MKIGITYDLKKDLPAGAGLPDDFQEEFDSPETVAAIAGVLRGMGHEVVHLGDGPELLDRLRADRPDLVFNIAEGEGVGRCREARVPALLELLGVPYTGSDPLALAATLDKDCGKRLVRGPEVLTPLGVVVGPDEDPLDVLRVGPPLPVVVKPAWEGSSKGIHGHCLVECAEDLPGVVESLRRDQHQPVLIEEYIPGAELTVGLVGNGTPQVLGILHVMPAEPTDHFLYSLEVKRDWKRRVRYEAPPRLPAEVLRRTERAALAACGRLGCRDVCRLDFRLDARGAPVFLEANPLPGLNPESGDLVILARKMGWTYEDLIGAILHAALARLRLVPEPARNPSPIPAPSPRHAVMEENRSAPEPKARVLIVHNRPILPADHPDAESEHEVLYTAEEVKKVLTGVGYRVDQLAIGRDPQELLTGVRERAPDVVFNLYEGMADDGLTEAHAAGLLEWLGVPFTGSTQPVLSLARNKPLAKHLFRGAGLPTPDFFVVGGGPVTECPLPWPVIVKPATEDASVGIDQDSVVTDLEGLNRQVARVVERFGGPVLVEEYIAGREFSIALVEAEELLVLPFSEIEFANVPEGCWPIESYDAKWKPESRDYESAPLNFDGSTVPGEWVGPLSELAKKAFRLLGCRDYARVDVRVRPDGRAYLLELNPNPDFSPIAGLACCLDETDDLPWADFTIDLVEQALDRAEKRADGYRKAG